MLFFQKFIDNIQCVIRSIDKHLNTLFSDNIYFKNHAVYSVLNK